MIAIALKQNPGSVRGPARIVVISAGISQAHLTAAVTIHRIDLHYAISIRSKDNLRWASLRDWPHEEIERCVDEAMNLSCVLVDTGMIVRSKTTKYSPAK